MRSVLFLCWLTAFATPSFAEQSLGVTSISVSDEEQGRQLSLSIWYPGSGGTQEEVGGNAVFTGALAGRDASLLEGRLPVVFVSHGGLRSAGDSGAWLSATLAGAGYIAIEVNAPRPETALAAVDEIWHRPDDVSRALDALLADPIWSKRIDQDRISVVGFALGGTAALALGGGQFQPQTFAQSCNEIEGGPDCAWYAAQNVSLDSVNMDELAKSRRDPRISMVVAIAPEYLDVFAEGLSTLDVPTLHVSLGNNSGSQALSQSPQFTQAVVSDADKFDAFQVCTVAGPEILAEDGGDPALCGTSAEARQRAHAAIASEIVAFLDGPRK